MTIRIRVLAGTAKAQLTQLQRQMQSFQNGVNKGFNVNGIRASGYAMTAAFTAPIAAASKAMFDYVLDNERAMTELKKVYGDDPTKDFGKDIDKLQIGFRKLSTVFGKNISEVNEIAAAWAAAGVSGAPLTSAVENTLKTMTIGGLSATEATKSLIAIQAQFGANSQQLTEILEYLNVVENQTGIDMAGLTEGFARVGGTAAVTGVTFQEVGSHLAALTPAAGSAINAANGLKTIYTRLMDPTEEASALLKQIGINTGELGWQSLGAGQRLELLAKKFEGLSTQQQAMLSKNLAGVYQFNRFSVVLKDIANGMDEAGNKTSYFNRAMEHARDPAYNAAIAHKELMAVLESNPVVFDRLKTSIKNDLMDVFVQLLPIIISMIATVKDLVHWFSGLDPSVQKATGVFLLILAALGPVLLMLAATGAAIRTLAVPFGLLARMFMRGSAAAKKSSADIAAANKVTTTSTQTATGNAIAANQARLTSQLETNTAMTARQAAFERNLAGIQAEAVAARQASDTRLYVNRAKFEANLEALQQEGALKRNIESARADDMRRVQFDRNLAQIIAAGQAGQAELAGIDQTGLARRNGLWVVAGQELQLTNAKTVESIMASWRAGMFGVQSTVQTTSGLVVKQVATMSAETVAAAQAGMEKMVLATRTGVGTINTTMSTGLGTTVGVVRTDGIAMASSWSGTMTAMEVRTQAAMAKISATTSVAMAGAARSAGSVAAVGTPTAAAGRAANTAAQNRQITNAGNAANAAAGANALRGGSRAAEKEAGKISQMLAKFAKSSGGFISRFLGPFGRILPFLGGIFSKIGPAAGKILPALGRVFARIPGLLLGAVKFIPRLLGGALRALTGIPGLILLAVLIVLDKFGSAIKGFFSKLGGWVMQGSNVFTKPIVFGVRLVQRMFNALPNGVKGAIENVVKIIAAAAMKVYHFLQYLNPFAHHSPSVVENVTNGMNVVMAQFARLSGVGAPIKSAYQDLQKFSGILAQVAEANYAAQKASSMGDLSKAGFGPDVLNAYSTLYDDMHALEIQAKQLNAVIQVQQAIVNDAADAVDRATAAYDEQNAVLDKLKDTQQEWQDKIDATKNAISDLSQKALPGQRAMEDQIFANEQAQKALQLQMMQIEKVTGPIDDVKSRMAELAAAQDSLRGNRDVLRSGGAGSEITGVYDQQITAIEEQKTAQTGLLDQYDKLQKALDDLQKKGQELDLQNSLDFDGLKRQIDQAANALDEMPFDQIMAGIAANNAALKENQAGYDAATAAVEKQQSVVDALNAAKEIATAHYDEENNKLKVMQSQYNQLNDAVGALNEQLQTMSSAADAVKASMDAAAAAAEDASSAFADAADAGDLDTGFGGGLDAGGGDIDAANAAIDDEFKDLLGGGGGLFSGLKDAWNGFVDWLKGIWNGVVDFFKDAGGKIKDGFNAVIEFFKDLPGKIGEFLMQIPGWLWTAISTLVTNMPRWLGYAIGYMFGLLVKLLMAGPKLMAWAFTKIWEFLSNGDMWSKIWGWITGGIGWVLSKIVDGLVGAGRMLYNGFLAAWNWLTSGDTWSGIASALWDGVQAMWNFVTSPEKQVELLVKVRDWVVGALSSAGSWLVDVGGNIISGLWSGISAAWDWFWGQITGFIGGFVKGFKDALGIKSPSTVFADIGKWILEGLWNGLQSVVQKIMDFFTGMIDWLKQRWTDFINGLKILWDTYGAPLVQGIINKWNEFKDAFWRVVDAVKGFFSGLFTDLSATYNNIKTLVIDKFTSAVDAIKNAFTNTVEGIKTKWNELKEAVQGPINFVVGTVFNNGLRTAFNWISDKIGGPHIDPIPGYAEGGLLRGPGTGTSDSILGIDKRGVPTARVSAGEFVINAKTTKQYLPFLDALNNDKIDLPKYADGGQVAGMFNWIKAKFPDANLNSGYRPGANDYHGQGKAVDLGRVGQAGGAGNAFLASMKQYIYDMVGKNTLELIYDGVAMNRPDLKNGAAHDYGAALRAQHTNHVHWAINSLSAIGGGAPDGGGSFIGNLINTAFDKVKDALGGLDPVKWLTDKVNGLLGPLAGNTDLAKMVRAAPAKLLSSAIEKVKSLFDGGGFLQPGLTMTQNNTGQPEAVLTNAQWNILKENANMALRNTEAVVALERYFASVSTDTKGSEKQQQTFSPVTVENNTTVNINGNLSFPNIKSGGDAADLVDDLVKIAKNKG